MYKPTMEGSNDLNEDLVIPIRKNTVTYDELRQKNREEYSKNQFNTSRLSFAQCGLIVKAALY